MKIGFSAEAFGNLLMLSAFIVIIVMGVIFFIAHKRGIDVTKHRFALTVTIGCAVVFAVIPFWLSDLSGIDKIIGTILMLSVGIGNYFAIDRMQRILREKLGDKRKENSHGKD